MTQRFEEIEIAYLSHQLGRMSAIHELQVEGYPEEEAERIVMGWDHDLELMAA